MQLSKRHIAQIKNYFTEKPVKRAYLFGSYSRKEAQKNSDIDLLVELDRSRPVGMQFFTFQEELEDLLNKKVDVISAEGISPHIKPIIDQDKILIYEK